MVMTRQWYSLFALRVDRKIMVGHDGLTVNVLYLNSFAVETTPKRKSSVMGIYTNLCNNFRVI